MMYEEMAPKVYALKYSVLKREKTTSAAALLEYSRIAGSSNNEMVPIQERFVSITHLIEF